MAISNSNSSNNNNRAAVDDDHSGTTTPIPMEEADDQEQEAVVDDDSGDDNELQSSSSSSASSASCCPHESLEVVVIGDEEHQNLQIIESSSVATNIAMQQQQQEDDGKQQQLCENEAANSATTSSIVQVRHRRNNHDCCTCCTVCTKYPMKKRKPKNADVLISNVLLWEYNNEQFDANCWDGGLYDLVRHMNEMQQYSKLETCDADNVVESTTKHLTKLQNQLLHAGLIYTATQNYCVCGADNNSGSPLSSARVLAPLDISEIELGTILGAGGFSSVYEVANIHLRENNQSPTSTNSNNNNNSSTAPSSLRSSANNSAEFIKKKKNKRTATKNNNNEDHNYCCVNNKNEQTTIFTAEEVLSRQYLQDHARLHPDDSLFSSFGNKQKTHNSTIIVVDKKKKASASSSNNNTPSTSHNNDKEESDDDRSRRRRPIRRRRLRQRGRHHPPYSRYVVKHLRRSFAVKSVEKFKRAAIDLVLEGQLLLVLDHPHIVSIRGRSALGPAAYASGYPQDYFLILDKLPVSLEDRMWEWRTKLIKYQKRYRRRTQRQEHSRRLSTWVRRRLLLRGGGGGEEQQEVSPNERDESPDSNNTTLPDKYAIKIQRQFLERLETAVAVASAIAYMHSKQLIHRDLKTSNIGFDDCKVVKLFDMGLSRLLPGAKAGVKATDSYAMSRVGTKYYMCPEVRHKKPYSLSADVYSFGVVLWEILSLASPRDVFHQQRAQQQQEQRKEHKKQQGMKTGKQSESTDGFLDYSSAQSWLPICPCWPKAVQDMVTAALSDDPDARPTMDEIHTELSSQVDSLRADLQVLSLDDRPPAGEPLLRRRSTFRLDLSHVSNNNQIPDDSNKAGGDDHSEDPTEMAANVEASGSFTCGCDPPLVAATTARSFKKEILTP